MSKSYFGFRIHFKKYGSDKVFYHKNIEESDALFADMVKQYKTFISVGETVKDDPGYYEDKYVVISKEDVEFPE